MIIADLDGLVCCRYRYEDLLQLLLTYFENTGNYKPSEKVVTGRRSELVCLSDPYEIEHLIGKYLVMYWWLQVKVQVQGSFVVSTIQKVPVNSKTITLSFEQKMWESVTFHLNPLTQNELADYYGRL